MQRTDHTDNKLLIYLPKSPFPRQYGPVCYFYSYLLEMQYKNPDFINAVPDFCYRLIDEIVAANEQKQADNERVVFLEEKEQAEREDKKIERIYKKYITPERLAKINAKYFSNFSVDTLFKSLDNSIIMAYLLELEEVEIGNNLSASINHYASFLREYGPFTVSGELLLNQSSTTIISTVNSYSIYAASQFEKNPCINGHAVTVIGCQTEAEEKIFYIDPNYPDKIITISFDDFIDRNLDNYIFTYQKNNHLQPDIDTIGEIKLDVESDTESESEENNEEQKTSEIVWQFWKYQKHHKRLKISDVEIEMSSDKNKKFI